MPVVGKIRFSPPKTDSEKNGALRFFTDHIFSHTSQRTENDGGAVRLFTAPDMRTECELAASRALELIRRHGCRRSDVAVAVRGFEDYRAPLEEAFRLYGVPLFTAGRGGMLQKPIPAFIEAAFRVLQGGWDSQDVLNYIKTGLTGLDRREADLLCGYVTLWSVKGSVWTKAAPWKQHPEGFGRERTEESDALLLKIDGIRRRLAGPLIRLWGRERSQATVLEHAQALTDFFSEISLPDSLAVHAGRLEAAGLDRQAEEFSQLWGLVCRALTQMTELLGNQHMDREEFFKLYLMTLSQYDVSGIPVSADSVSAGELDRMRRRHIKHLIILGASDDRLPRTDEEAGILNQEDRQALSSLGLEIGQCADPLSRELSLIYNCVSLPSETLTVSYSETDGSGALSRPGLLIARAAMLFGLEPERTVLDKLRLSAPGPALLLAAGVSEAGGPGRLARAFFEESPSGRDRLEDIDRRAAFIAGSLSPERVEELYGKTLSISPTRADAFLSCRFSYFLRYGLRLNEREKADFEAPELGSYMHYILEKCVQEIALSPGFEKATQSLAHSLADKYTDLYIQERLGGLEDKSPRFVFLFNRLREPVRRVAWDMVRELSRSDFRPLDFELSFGKNGKLPSIELGEGRRRLLVSGVADRVDGYFQDGKLYLRVMDYKTGKKAFSLSDVWYGMGMQMLLYLFALEEMGVSRYGVEVVPAGVLYVPAKDAVVSAPGDLTEEELSAEKAKARRRSGLLLEDPELLQAMERGHDPEYLPVRYRDGELRPSDSLAGTAMFASLRGHVEGRLLELSDEITQGRVDAEPCYKSASDNACLYCAYKRVCRFDESRGKRRRLETIKPAEFWERLGGEGK